MLAPVFRTTVGIAAAPLMAATTALCISLVAVKELLTSNGFKSPKERLADLGLDDTVHVPGG